MPKASPRLNKVIDLSGLRKRKARFNAFVNLCMFVFMLTVSVSGILLGAGRSGDRLEGLSQLWVHLHIATCIIFLVLIVTHLLLHIPYIKKLPRLLAGRRPHTYRDERLQEVVTKWPGSETSAGIR